MANQYSPQTEALMQRLRPAGAAPAPVTPAASLFARGGQVKQLPGFDKNKVAEMGASTAANVAGKVLGNTAGGAAAGAGIGLATGALADKLKVKEDMPTFGGANGAYLDDYGRRFEGTGGGVASNAVRYAGYGANPALVAATGGLSVAAGALGGAIKGAVTKNAPSAYTDFRVENAAEGIKKMYAAELGREASDDEVMTHLKNVGFDPTGGDRWAGEKSTNYILDQIRASPEAQAFKAGGGPAAAEGAAGAPAAGAAPADPLGAGGGDPFSRGTQAMRAALAAPAAPAAGATGAEPVARVDPLTRGAQASQGDPAEMARIRAEMGLGGVADGINADGSGGITGRGAGGAVLEDAAADAGAPAADTSGWNTDGYTPPAFAVAPNGPALPGWDNEKWNDPNHQTPKYVWGRIAAANQGNPQKQVEELLKAYPGATFNGKDKVSGIPGLGPIDIFQGASSGQNTPQWIDEANAGGGDAPADGGQQAGAGLIDATGGASNQGDVQAIIAQLIGREGQASSGGLAQALLNKMRQTA